MKIDTLLNNSLKAGDTSLTEYDSKRVLAAYGIPAVSETMALLPEEAADAAEQIGFPVVVKGMGSRLLHKTEMGLVHLNLQGEPAVLDATQKITESAGPYLEGFLVQPFVEGKREWVAGMFRDPQFGPVIMFGAGGIFAEALSDVSVRLPPYWSRANPIDLVGEPDNALPVNIIESLLQWDGCDAVINYGRK